jgi:hypothetical protein
MNRYFPPVWYGVIIFVCLIVACSPDPPFNKVQQKHSHNSYYGETDKGSAFLFWQAYSDMIRSFELDLHNAKNGSQAIGDWYVFHQNPGSYVPLFSEELQQFKSVEGYIPNHEVITVWLEFKDPVQDSNHSPALLDYIIKNTIDVNKIFTPKDLLNRCSGATTLRESVIKCGWPKISELRGKYMFVVLSIGSEVDGYFYAYNNQTSVAFLQSKDKWLCPDNCIFLNNDGYSDPGYTDVYVNRITAVNDIDGWASALKNKVQYIGTDTWSNSNDYWATTNNILEWPFRCPEVGFDCSANQEKPPSFAHGFPYQLYWGSRTGGVGYSGLSEWFVDLDGDGRRDYIYNVNGGQEYRVMYNFNDKFSTEFSWGSRSCGVGYDGRSEWFVDINGDGKADQVYNCNGGQEIRVRLSNGKGFDPEKSWGSRTTGVGYNGHSEWIVDLNGDGKLDHINNADGGKTYMVMLARETGDGFYPDANWGSRGCGVGYHGRSEWFVDLNGDKKADQVYNCDGGRDFKVRISNGHGFNTEATWRSRKTGVANSGWSEWFVDLNGDGKADHINNGDGGQEYWVMLSTGNGFATDVSWGSSKYPVAFGGKAQWFVDIDGDGLPDHVYNRANTNEYYFRHNTGSSFAADQFFSMRAGDVVYNTADEYTVIAPEWFVDINGDGKADHISNRYNTLFGSIYPDMWVRMNKF